VPLNAAPCAQATPITDPPEESDAFIATMLRAVNHGHTPTAFIPTPPEPGQGAGEGGPRGVIPVRPRTFEDVLVDALGRRGWWNEL
jgi:hypothetical protein